MIRVLALAVLLAPTAALAQGLTYEDRSGTITAGGTAQVVLPLWMGRHGCMIQNQSAGSLWVSETATAVAGPPSVLIPAGQQFLCMVPASGPRHLLAARVDQRRVAAGDDMTVSISTIAERALRRLNVAVVPLDDRPTLTEMVPVATIATMALTELGVIASDETPSATDQALALDKVASVHAALDAQGLVWWDGTAVPRAFVEEYVKLAAGQASTSFGKASDPASLALLEGRIRRGVMGIASHDIAVEAVMAVHTDLVAKGIARWSSQDIPDMAALPYEMLTAYDLAPKFPPAEQDKAEVAQAMSALFKITALPSSGERIVAEYF